MIQIVHGIIRARVNIPSMESVRYFPARSVTMLKGIRLSELVTRLQRSLLMARGNGKGVGFDGQRSDDDCGKAGLSNT